MARSRDCIWVADRSRTGPWARPIAHIVRQCMNSVAVALHRCLEAGRRRRSNPETDTGRALSGEQAGICIKQPLLSHSRLHLKRIGDRAQDSSNKSWSRPRPIFCLTISSRSSAAVRIAANVALSASGAHQKTERCTVRSARDDRAPKPKPYCAKLRCLVLAPTSWSSRNITTVHPVVERRTMTRDKIISRLEVSVPRTICS